MDIDWSKAPEGATHYCVGSLDNTHWRDYSEDRAKYWLEGEWHSHPFTSAQCLAIPGDIARPVWNGEGLPPVGTACEVQHPEKPDTWCKCTILVWDSECAVFSADANYPFAYDGNGYPESFRPIRTPEQIAAEETLRDIERLYFEGGPAAVFDAGYRKFEIVEGE